MGRNNLEEITSGCAASTDGDNPRKAEQARILRTILFAVALLSIFLAFNSGPSFLGMFFALVSISCFGYALGCIMNSPEPCQKENSEHQ